MNRFKALAESILFVIIAVLIQIMVTFLAGMYFSLKSERLGTYIINQEDLIIFMQRNNLIIILIGWIITLLFLYVVLTFSKQNVLRVIKLNKKISLLHIIICIICGMGMNLAINGLLSITNISNMFPKYNDIISSIVEHKFYLTFICAGIFIPIGEEILYRGIVLNKLRNGFSIFTAIIIQAILFGISHMNVVQGVYAFVLGIVFGYVVIWTGSLYSSIILHIIINSLSVIIANMGELNIGYNNMITFTSIGLLLSIIGLRILYMDRHKQKENIIRLHI